MEEIKVNLDNLTNEERETLLKLVEKGNKTNKKRWRGNIVEDGKVSKYYYHYIDDNSIITNCMDYDTITDNARYDIGNYFKTKEEAIFARDKQFVYQQLKDYALEHNTEKIDWNNHNQSKWSITYDDYRKELKYFWSVSTRDISQIYFTSKEIAKTAVEEIGEDNIKKYLFGIGE